MKSNESAAADSGLTLRYNPRVSGPPPLSSCVSHMEYTPQHAQQALDILECLLPRVTPRREYEDLISILRDPTRWKEAHAQFTKIRVNITLPSERQKETNTDHYFIYVAENAAKTAYNCSGEPAPFDEDSFDWLSKCEQEILERTRTNV